MTKITLNGSVVETKAATLAQLIDSMELTNKRYAVEVNGELVLKSNLENTPIAEQMNVEVVVAVGGG